MLSDVELGYRLLQRSTGLMREAFYDYAEACSARQPLDQLLAHLKYEVFRSDVRVIRRWLVSKQIAALLANRS